MEKFSASIEDRFTGRYLKCIQISDVTQKTILDIGCFNGWFVQYAYNENGAEIVGIDIDQNILNIAKEKVVGDNISFYNCSVLDLSQFRKNYFDLIIMYDVIEHLPRKMEQKALKEIYRILKYNGELLISTPNKTFLSCLLDPAYYFGHRHYTLTEIERILHTCGYKVQSFEYGGRIIELLSIIILYNFKWIFKREIPFKNWVEKKRNKEYIDSNKGFTTLFVKAIKIAHVEEQKS